MWLPGSYSGYKNANPNLFVIFAADRNNSNSSFLTNVGVISEKVHSDINLEAYLYESSKNFPPEIRIVEMKTSFGEGYEIGKIITETSIGVSGKQIYYVIKDGGTVWTVIFSTGASKFEAQLPTFEASIRTFSTKL
ncbi:hypothetical protein A6770_04505 [Nostoc minutum NIES-26]|uniref:DUF1795 domain-containing protein n=1 Tax=Nostoc minutum NIES-26 TaxID=1844469 RepID=A0A367QDT5_9NOSO|nr:hypothetical protein A6770_04505 [Nostoc minutum NIES-26]